MRIRATWYLVAGSKHLLALLDALSVLTGQCTNGVVY